MNDETPDITPERGDARPAGPGGVSRRRLLGAVGAGAVAGAALGAGGTALAGGAGSSPAQSAGEGSSAERADGIVPFRAAHQAGIATPAQDRLCFATFDVQDFASKDDLRELLRTWTTAAEAMTRGRQVPGGAGGDEAPPEDTGEAVGLTPGHLTITVGYGPGLFDDRFGLAGRRPSALKPLPRLPGEDLDAANSGGDLCVQACSDDPQVAFHAIRNLRRLGFGTTVPRYLELGFGKTSTTSPTTPGQATPRNLMGFKDGTRNIDATDAALMGQHVWIGDEEPQRWMRGGSYLVSRKIRMLMEQWDRDVLGDQQKVFGRFKSSGAPLTGHKEFDAPDFKARSAGDYVIPADSHMRLAAHENNKGVRILRRGYSYTDGIDAETGDLLGGLFFIAYMKNPDQFTTLQRVLGRHDALNEYIQHVSGGLFAVPPGLGAGQNWGDQLFGA